MNAAEIIRRVCADQKITFTELARRTGQFPSSLSRKLARNSFTMEELQHYMEVLGAGVDISIVYPDGETIEPQKADDRALERIAVLESQLLAEKKNAAFMKRLARDIRTEMDSISGYTELALKRLSDTSAVEDYLNKTTVALGNVDRVLFHTMGAAEASEEVEVEMSAELVRGKRVLLVDDNEMNREIAKEMLLDNGLLVDEVSNGSTAVEKIMKAVPSRYDFILMDIQMPLMDGWEATEKIRALPNRVRATIPIIAMTANAFPEDRDKSFEVGMDAYLTKPISAKKLLSALSRFV